MTALLPEATPTNTTNASNGSKRMRPVAATIEGQYYLTGGLEIPANLKTPTAKKERQILALLLVEAGRSVSLDRLTNELWGHTPPRAYVQTIQTYIMKLRDCLGDAQRQIISTTGGGYLLQVDPSWVDVLRFAHETKDIWLRGSETEEKLLGIMQAVDTALSHLRGPVLLGVKCGPLLGDWVAVFDESITQAHSRWIEAALRLRRYDEVIVRSLPLFQQDPLCENFAKWRMLALYCRGRSRDALDIYRCLRELTIAELGLEPGPQVRELHQRIISRDREVIRNSQSFI